MFKVFNTNCTLWTVSYTVRIKSQKFPIIILLLLTEKLNSSFFYETVTYIVCREPFVVLALKTKRLGPLTEINYPMIEVSGFNRLIYVPIVSQSVVVPVIQHGLYAKLLWFTEFRIEWEAIIFLKLIQLQVIGV